MDREYAIDAVEGPSAQPPSAAVSDDRVVDGKARAGDASELFKILAHRTRFLVLCRLAERERSVTELEMLLDLPQAAVSQQLARLRLQGIVSTRRDGRNIFYQLASEGIRDLLKAAASVAARRPAPRSA